MSKIIVLTGGTNGFGRLAAQILAAQGHQLILLARNLDKGAQVAAEIHQHRPSAAVEVLPGDLADLRSVHAFAQAVAERHNHVDVLVNNGGGVLPTDGAAARPGPNLTVNYLAPASLCLALRPLLKPGALIVNTASVGEWLAKVNTASFEADRLFGADYPTAKRALLMFSFALSRRLSAHEINVRAFHPGICPPPAEKPGLLRRLLDTSLLNPPEKVAAALAQLATHGSPYDYVTINGRKARSSPSSQNLALQERLWSWTTAFLDRPSAATSQAGGHRAY